MMEKQQTFTFLEKEILYARIGLARPWNNGYWLKARCYPMLVSLLTDKEIF